MIICSMLCDEIMERPEKEKRAREKMENLIKNSRENRVRQETKNLWRQSFTLRLKNRQQITVINDQHRECGFRCIWA